MTEGGGERYFPPYAYDSSTDSPKAECSKDENKVPGPGKLSTEAGGLHPCFHHHAEKTQLRPAEGGPCAAFQWI